LSHPALALVGQDSFRLYLLHWFLIPPVVQSGVPQELKGAVVVGLSLAAGLVSHKLIEAPAEALGAPT